MLKHNFWLWSGVQNVHVPVQQPIIICNKSNRSSKVAATSYAATSSSTSSTPGIEISSPSSFPLFQNTSPPEPSPAFVLELADPDFYKIGYVRSFRAYGIEFREVPDGFGVYATKDVQALHRARVIMEIPLELMLTISRKTPWMFIPDVIPIGHPIFDIINSTNPEDSFWTLYGDFLPGPDDCASLLLATEEDLLELQDEQLASTMREQQQRALEFGKRIGEYGTLSMHQHGNKNWFSDSRCQYVSSLRWDRMLEVMINAGQAIKRGEEMTVNYSGRSKNDCYMQRYGFSSPDVSYQQTDNFVDGTVLAAARTLPAGDIRPIPSIERKAAKELQDECQLMLSQFPTNFQEDQQILGTIDSTDQIYSQKLQANKVYCTLKR